MNRLWFSLAIGVLAGLIIGLPYLLSHLRKVAGEISHELATYSNGSAYDGNVEPEEEELITQPLPPEKPLWARQIDEILVQKEREVEHEQ